MNLHVLHLNRNMPRDMTNVTALTTMAAMRNTAIATANVMNTMLTTGNMKKEEHEQGYEQSHGKHKKRSFLGELFDFD